MDELPVIRDWQFELLLKLRRSVRHTLEMAPREALRKYRDSGTGWTVAEVLCHLRDFEGVFLERAKLTVREDFPDLPFPDPERLAIELRYAQEDAWKAFEDWHRRREAYVDFLQNLPEAAWARQGNHPTRGPMTLNQQLFLTSWHDLNHMEQITRILSEKR